MKKYLFVLLLINISLLASSTDSSMSVNPIEPKFVVGVNLSQIAFSNWAKGGENSFTWTILSDFDLKYFNDNWTLRNEFDISYGRTKLGGSSFRINNNEINLESVLAYKVGWIVDPFLGNSIRTQVTNGYDYEKNPDKSIVDFFDPAYVTQSFGFTYDKLSVGTTRFGIALQETFTNVHTQYSDDIETDKVENFKFETGIESVTNGEMLIDTNIRLKSKLRLFTRFESLDVWDVYWDNKFVSKLNSYLQVNFDVVIIYEKSQSLRTQAKEAFQLGITYTVI